jgi:carbon storage regulator
MLVLSRKSGERIHVGDQITIEVRRIAGNRVTLALEAPRDVRILRGELEHAVREFQASPAEQNGSAKGPAPAHSLSVMSGLPGQVVNRDYVI